MKRDISIYLKDILENMERIETFTTGMGYDDFVSDEKTHFAVIRCPRKLCFRGAENLQFSSVLK